MPDLFGKKQLGRASNGGRFYATPTERVEAGEVYLPNESSLLFGVAEYTVEAGDLGAFATEGTFVFERPNDWLDSLGRKVFFRPSTGEIVNQDKKGDVLIGFQIFANVPDDKLGVVLTSGENSVVIIVTSTADSGEGSLRQAILDAQNGDVILFDPLVFPAGQTTSILLSSYLYINKSVSIYGGESDGNGGYTSGATKKYYVYREIKGVKTKTYIDDDNPSQVGETILLENVCRVALDGQNAVRCVYITSGLSAFAGIAIANGNATSGGGFYSTNTSQNTLNDCSFDSCSATSGGGVYQGGTSQNTLNGCSFDSCSATNGGGVYSGSSSQNTLKGCTIAGCSATTSGGGFYSTNTSQNTLNDCNISNCSATFAGGVYARDTSANILNGCTFDTSSTVYIANTSSLTISGGITTIAEATLGTATITITDGAALTITTSATIGAATISSDGRGYLALAPGLDSSAATITNVVLCTYGAGLESFNIDADGASWTAQDLTTPILIEQRESDATWTTLSSVATGGTYSDSFDVGTTLRAFDGVRFFVASLDAYWRVDASFGAANGGGGAGDDAPLWNVSDETITPNLEEI